MQQAVTRSQSSPVISPCQPCQSCQPLSTPLPMSARCSITNNTPVCSCFSWRTVRCVRCNEAGWLSFGIGFQLEQSPMFFFLLFLLVQQMIPCSSTSNTVTFFTRRKYVGAQPTSLRSERINHPHSYYFMCEFTMARVNTLF